jgi:2-methylcitrate dehydratase PrpD
MRVPLTRECSLASSAERFAEFAAGFTFTDLPPHLRELTKLLLLDTVGVAIAASSIGVGCREALSYARTCFGSGESALWGSRERTSPMGAAFGNGALAHALNYDALGVGYVGLIAPAIIAAADTVPGITGPEVLAGLAIGAELSARIHAAARSTRGMVLDGQLQSYFGCAIGAAKVMRLPPAGMHDTLGLALMQAAGSVQIVIEGDPPAKAIYGAFPNQGGLQAALLARSGVNAGCDAFDGHAGLFRLHYSQIDKTDPLKGLGREYLIEGARLKPWPVSAALFPLIEAAIALVVEHHISADEIDAVHINIQPALRMWIEPEPLRRAPPNAAAAANSLFFAVAKVLSNGNLTLDDFTDSGLRDPAAAELARKIETSCQAPQASSITVTTRSGARQRQTPSEGSPSEAMSQAQVESKFRKCMQYAIDSRLHERADALLATILNFDAADDYRELTRVLACR